jgi:prepilin-type N-terminal cleavage/methylation domain-containing protein
MVKNKLNNMSGFTLIEVLVAVAIISIVAVGALTALTAATKARFQADVRTTAVTIAETTIEAIKNQTFTYKFAPGILTGADYSTVLLDLPPIPPNFRIYTLSNENHGTTLVADKMYGLPWDLATNTLIYDGNNPADPGIQKVTVIVQYDGKEIYRLADFKVLRN